MEIPVALSLLLSGIYMAAEMTGRDMSLNILYVSNTISSHIVVSMSCTFAGIKKMVLKKNTKIIMMIGNTG